MERQYQCPRITQEQIRVSSWPLISETDADTLQRSPAEQKFRVGLIPTMSFFEGGIQNLQGLM